MARREPPAPRTKARRRLIEKLLAERAETGESYRMLEERTGIPAPTLAWWQKKLRDENGRADRVELIEVESAERWLSSPAAVELELPSGMIVRVPLAAGLDVIGQILDLVSAQC